MKQKFLLLLVALLIALLAGCAEAPNESRPGWQEIAGRDERLALYRARVPSGWHRSDPAADDPLLDTTKPLCEFMIKDENEQIIITIHNFPTATMEERVPPTAQAARWKRQFSTLDPLTESLQPQSFGGFAGLVFYGEGTIKGAPQAVLAWAMQMPPEHFLEFQSNDKRSNRQMRADYTIKAVGDPTLLSFHRDAITAFARSFELIEEIPSPP